jgi:beta-barrel assembly-enhancing protease
LNKYRIDDKKTVIANEFFAELNIDNKTRVYVIAANEFNAFATPGNYIFLFDNVFENLKSYPELTALLAHEYAHIQNRHGIRKLAHELTRDLVTGFIWDDDKGAGKLVKNANLLLTLGNSREFETQADIQAFQLLRDKKIDPKGLVDLFKLMEKIERKSSNNKHSYLKTHPDTEERLDLIQDSIKASPYDPTHFEKLEDIFQKLNKNVDFK